MRRAVPRGRRSTPGRRRRPRCRPTSTGKRHSSTVGRAINGSVGTATPVDLGLDGSAVGARRGIRLGVAVAAAARPARRRRASSQNSTSTPQPWASRLACVAEARPGLERQPAASARGAGRSPSVGEGAAALGPAAARRGRAGERYAGRAGARPARARKSSRRGHRQHHHGRVPCSWPGITSQSSVTARRRRSTARERRGAGLGGGDVGRRRRRSRAVGAGRRRRRRRGRRAGRRPPRRARRVGEDARPRSARASASYCCEAASAPGAEPAAQVVVGGEPAAGRRPSRRPTPGSTSRPSTSCSMISRGPGRAVEADARARPRPSPPARTSGKPSAREVRAAIAALAHSRGHVGRLPGQLDAVPEAELADLADELVALRAVAEDPQPPAREPVGDLGEGVDRAWSNCFSATSRPAETITRRLERGARGEAQRQRVGHHHDLGARARRAARAASRRSLGVSSATTSARGANASSGSRPEVRSEEDRCSWCTTHDGVRRRSWTARGEQRRGHGDEHVGVEAGQRRSSADVGERA